MPSNNNIPTIPAITIRPRGELAHPTANGIDGYLEAAIAGGNQPLQLSSEHRLIPLSPTSPHTTGSHMVYWLDAGTGDKVSPWNKDVLIDSLNDTEFWSNAQAFLENEISKTPGLRAYSYMGFAPYVGTLPNVSPVGMQSQPRTHIHLAEKLDLEQANIIGSLDPDTQQGREWLSQLVNEGGEKVLDKLDMDGFGTEFIFRRHLGYPGDPNRTEVSYTMFGFASLQEAIESSKLLADSSMHFWQRTLAELASQKAEFLGVDLPPIQMIVPNFVIMIPDEESRNNADLVGRASKVWVMPFASTGAQVLVDGGVVIQRATPVRK